MGDNSRISNQKAPKPVGLYPHARKVGNLLFLSGVGPRKAGSDDSDSEVPGLQLDKNGNLKTVHSFIEDRNGYLWMSTNNGLYKINIDEINNFLNYVEQRLKLKTLSNF